MKIYNFCLFLGFNRKTVMKAIHALLQQNYGSFKELTSMTMLELTEIERVLISLDQEETLEKAGL